MHILTKYLFCYMILLKEQGGRDALPLHVDSVPGRQLCWSRKSQTASFRGNAHKGSHRNGAGQPVHAGNAALWLCATRLSLPPGKAGGWQIPVAGSRQPLPGNFPPLHPIEMASLAKKPLTRSTHKVHTCGRSCSFRCS